MSENSDNLEKFDSMTHFLQTGGFEYRVFEMGRKVAVISNDLFEQLENQKEVYPAPFQKKASIALLLWELGKQAEATIWFLQFPIDELGFLKLEARDAFLIDLLEQAGKNIHARQVGKAVLDELKESPFAFKPSPERLAIFHSLAMKVLAQAPSHYYKATREYLLGNLGFEQWQFLGLQGIADVVARLDDDENEALLVQALSKIPDTPLISFCNALENVSPQEKLTQALVARLKIELDAGDNNQLVAMLLRAISGSSAASIRVDAIRSVLASDFGGDIEVLVAISARAWKDLQDEAVLDIFMHKLASLDQTAFDAVLSDLIVLPEMRKVLLVKIKEKQKEKQQQSKILQDKLSHFRASIGESS